jgi:hypothetical protein
MSDLNVFDDTSSLFCCGSAEGSSLTSDDDHDGDYDTGCVVVVTDERADDCAT